MLRSARRGFLGLTRPVELLEGCKCGGRFNTRLPTSPGTLAPQTQTEKALCALPSPGIQRPIHFHALRRLPAGPGGRSESSGFRQSRASPSRCHRSETVALHTRAQESASRRQQRSAARAPARSGSERLTSRTLSGPAAHKLRGRPQCYYYCNYMDERCGEGETQSKFTQVGLFTRIRTCPCKAERERETVSDHFISEQKILRTTTNQRFPSPHRQTYPERCFIDGVCTKSCGPGPVPGLALEPGRTQDWSLEKSEAPTPWGFSADVMKRNAPEDTEDQIKNGGLDLPCQTASCLRTSAAVDAVLGNLHR
ncbi:hypothetical protein H920_12684 [Fukomys damarensis]|uniref:Uncharacterized protein n=1 Tax=Fukomys damarensis TaxID=885580 RepID=A0A091D5Z9_FUKDA|nr:hypothetical protein H920_12684 [Fukomys damarensis]